MQTLDLPLCSKCFQIKVGSLKIFNEAHISQILYTIFQEEVFHHHHHDHHDLHLCPR